MKLQGKVALVTGGAHRIGRGLVLGLAKAGCRLVLHYNRSAEAAERTAQEVAAHGAQVVTYQADLANPSEVASLVGASVAGGLGDVQILVNSAAIFPEDSLLDLSPELWERTMRINLTSPLFLTQAFARALPETSRGAVINITDWRTARPYTKHFSYTVAKGALDTFTLAAASELAPRIRVNGIALGAMLPPPHADQSYLAELAAQLPLQRAGGVAPVVQAMLYLLQNDFVTGEIVRLNGGAHLT
ncbi:MAG: SDR family NAD(P)-dependent oxidoreductase [Ardenticatenaceae bacterium]